MLMPVESKHPPLTDNEQAVLEDLIGVGSVEHGAPLSDLAVSACRKLGLSPTDWHGNRLMPDDALAE
jgi:hypothetical protein